MTKLTEAQRVSADVDNDESTSTHEENRSSHPAGWCHRRLPAGRAGTASASTSSFLSAVHGVGWYSNQNGDASLAHNGSLVCQWLDSGRSEWSVTNTVYQNTGYDVSWADAQEFVGIAQSHLC